MVAKVNVSLPEDVLKELDRVARERQTSRSAFLVKAFKHYLEELQDEERQEKRVKAVETIRAVAEELGEWDAVGELLKSRDSH